MTEINWKIMKGSFD